MVAPCACQTGPVPSRRARLFDARLYLVCDAQSDAFLEAALRGGVDVVQLRMKDAGDDAIYGAAERFARLCARHRALFVVNDRPDLAAAVGADGVHLGQDDGPVSAARERLGPERLIGLSTHTPAQIEAAGGGAVDYIGVGPIHQTPTKPGRPAGGLELVADAAAHARVPFFAIGGLDAAGAPEVRAAGGRRIAVVRALTEAEDPAAAAGELRAAIAGSEARVGAA